MFCWLKTVPARVGVAWCFLFFDLWNQTWPKFVSSSENFNVGQEKGDSVDGLCDGSLDFRSVDDSILEV